MMYLNQGERLYVFASKAGADTNPDWYLNLVSNPEVTVELGVETFAATANALTGEEREHIYDAQAKLFPGFAEYQENTNRVIPVVELVRA